MVLIVDTNHVLLVLVSVLAAFQFQYPSPEQWSPSCGILWPVYNVQVVYTYVIKQQGEWFLYSIVGNFCCLRKVNHVSIHHYLPGLTLVEASHLLWAVELANIQYSEYYKFTFRSHNFWNQENGLFCEKFHSWKLPSILYQFSHSLSYQSIL